MNKLNKFIIFLSFFFENLFIKLILKLFSAFMAFFIVKYLENMYLYIFKTYLKA